MTGMVSGDVVTRDAIKDGLVDLRVLEADPLWERDDFTENWFRRTTEFFAARVESEAALPAQREAAEIALGVALLELAKELPPQEDGPPHAYISGVGRYETICSDDSATIGVRRTSRESVSEWRRRLLAYAATSRGDIVWWRKRPTIAACVLFGETEPSWVVHARLVIGNAADTIIERVRRGEVCPSAEMVTDNVVTLEQLTAVGYSYDAAKNEWARPGWFRDVFSGAWVKTLG